MAVTRYQIQVGNEIITFEGPDDLSHKQIEQLADTHLKNAKPGQVFPHSVYVDTFGNKPAGDTETQVPLEDIRNPDESSTFGAFIRNLPHEAYANWDDEIAAAANAVVPGFGELENATGMSGGDQQSMYGGKGFWDTFNHNLEDYKRQQEADDALHPTASARARILGLVGSLPAVAETTAARVPLAIKEAMAARPVFSSAIGSSILTGASAAGQAQPGDKAQSAALGAVTGFGLGPAAYAASELAPAVANYARVFLGKGSTQEALRQIVTSLKRDGFDVSSPTGVQRLKSALQEYTGKPVSLADLGAATRTRALVGLDSPSNVQQQSIDKLLSRQAGQGQRLAADVRANVAPRTDVHALDDQLVAQRAEQAEALREKALFEQGRVRNTNPEGELSLEAEGRGYNFNYYHPSGETVSGELIMHPGGRAEISISPRAEEGYHFDSYENSANRLGPSAMRDLLSQIKTELPDVKTLFGTRLSGARQAESRKAATASINMENVPIYHEGAAGRQSRMVDSPELQQLARLPLAQRALEASVTQAEAERGLLAAQGKDISHLPDITTKGNQLDMRSFDYLKRFLDDEVNRLYKGSDTSTFKAAQLQQVKGLRDAIREKLKAYNPDYADYLNAYSGSSEMIDSLRAGGKFDQLSPEQIAAEQAERSTAGQELYRTAAGRRLLDKINETRDTGKAASSILNSDEARAQLLATGVDPAKAAELNRRVAQERVLSLLNRGLGNDASARKAAIADTDAGLDHVVPIIPGNPAAWFGMGARKVFNHMSTGRNAAVNEELLPRMIENDPVALNRVIKELEQHGNVAAARELRRRSMTRKLTGMGSVVIGSSVALPEE